VAIIRARAALDKLQLSGDEATGVTVLKQALETPIRIIAANSGAAGEVILVESIKGKGDWGYDAEKNEFCHLLEHGIMDPAKVTRSAVENAASVASMVLTTESLVTEIKSKEKMPAMPPPMDY
jgi:chaperonin GroEL